jgi:hypothetical protein
MPIPVPWVGNGGGELQPAFFRGEVIFIFL